MPVVSTSTRRRGFMALAFALFLAAVLDALLVRQVLQLILGAMIISASAGLAALAVTCATRATISAVVLAAAIIVVQAVAMLTGEIVLSAAAQTGAFVLAAVAFLLAHASRISGPSTRRSSSRIAVMRVTRLVAGATAVLVAASAVVVPLAPGGLLGAQMSALGFGNSFAAEGEEEAQALMANGALRTSDIRYADDYPNSFLDVYIADGNPDIERPTYLYVHGGGFIGGDKGSGDPNVGTDTTAIIYDPVLAAGYNLVTINYALAPEYTYPTPVLQLSQAMEFLQSEGDKFGLDVSSIVLAGGSAGGQIAAQFANIETSAAYAAHMNVKQVTNGNLSALVLDSAALDPSRAVDSQSPSLTADVLFGLSLRTYVGLSSSTIHEASIEPFATADFPSTFLADGNSATFPDQAQSLHARLQQLGVESAIYIPSTSTATVGHGFMAAPGPLTNEYNALKFDFLESFTP